MKSGFFIIGALLLCPLITQARDCVTCTPYNAARRLLPAPLTSDLRRVVAPLVTIQTPNLRRRAGAEECRRNVNVADTIVFHHSDTPPSETIEGINDAHLNRYSPRDPWLMIGYHYAIRGPYAGGTGGSQVYRGRPMNIAGAHAGSDSYRSVSTATRNLLRQENAVQCGVAGGRFTSAADRFQGNRAKANYTTVGVVIIGNYAPLDAQNPGGYPRGRVRYPSSAVIENAGRLACELQRRYPRLTRISYHSAYNYTECPGTIRERIENIKAVAARFGCSFN